MGTLREIFFGDFIGDIEAAIEGSGILEAAIEQSHLQKLLIQASSAIS